MHFFFMPLTNSLSDSSASLAEDELEAKEQLEATRTNRRES